MKNKIISCVIVLSFIVSLFTVNVSAEEKIQIPASDPLMYYTFDFEGLGKAGDEIPNNGANRPYLFNTTNNNAGNKVFYRDEPIQGGLTNRYISMEGDGTIGANLGFNRAISIPASYYSKALAISFDLRVDNSALERRVQIRKNGTGTLSTDLMRVLTITTNPANTAVFFAASATAAGAVNVPGLDNKWHNYTVVLDFVENEKTGKKKQALAYFDGKYIGKSEIIMTDANILASIGQIDIMNIVSTAAPKSGMINIDNVRILAPSEFELSGPVIEGTDYPVLGGESVPPRSNIEMTFTNRIDLFTMEGILTKKDGENVSYSIENTIVDYDKHNFVIIPDMGFENETEYKFDFSGIKDIYGNSLPSSVVSGDTGFKTDTDYTEFLEEANNTISSLMPSSAVKDMILPTSLPITIGEDTHEVSISWESSNQDIISNIGKITRDTYKGADKAVELTPTFRIKAASLKGNTYTIIVPKQNSAEGLAASASSNSADAVNLTDGSLDTSWTSDVDDNAPEVIVTLPNTKQIDGFTLKAGAVYGTPSFKVYTSADKVNWTLFCDSPAVAAGAGQAIIERNVTSLKYMKIVFDGGPVDVKNIYFEVSKKAVTEIDAAKIVLDTSTIASQDFIYLHKKGESGDTVITWSSSPSGYIFPEGTIVRPTDSDKSVKLIALIEYKDENDDVIASATREFPGIIVPKKIVSSTAPPSGSGGGGGSMYGFPAATPPVLIEVEPETNEDEHEFSDIEDNHWAKEYIYKLAERGVVSKADMFNPANSITRAEFVKMLVIALELESDEEKGVLFDDVTENDWFYDYVTTAYRLNLVNGITDTEFAPNNFITRQDIAAIIGRVVDFPYNEEPEYKFKDQAEIRDYALSSVMALYSAGIVSGFEDGTFKPQALASRAEIAKLVCLIMD